MGGFAERHTHFRESVTSDFTRNYTCRRGRAERLRCDAMLCGCVDGVGVAKIAYAVLRYSASRFTVAEIRDSENNGRRATFA